MSVPIPPPPRARRPDPGGDGGPALAKVATQHEARARHPTGGGRPPRPPEAAALKGSPLAWSIVIGVIAASALLWSLLVIALFGALGEFMALQADIVTQLGRITIVQCDTSGYGCDEPYGIEGEDPYGPAGRIGDTS